MTSLPDVDIDVKDRDKVAALLPFTPATELSPDQTRLVKHKTGLYPQAIPVDTDSGLAAFPYEYAEHLGYYKVDLIPNHVYDQIESEAHLREILREKTDWSWFLDERFYEGEEPLTLLGGHFDLVQKYPPKSIADVAILLALRLPGKRNLVGSEWDHIRTCIWIPNPDKTAYTYKLPHATAFATLVVVHAKLLVKKLSTPRSASEFLLSSS